MKDSQILTPKPLGIIDDIKIEPSVISYADKAEKLKKLIKAKELQARYKEYAAGNYLSGNSNVDRFYTQGFSKDIGSNIIKNISVKDNSAKLRSSNIETGIIKADEASKRGYKAADIAVRQAYVNEVRGLGSLEQTLRAEGKSIEEIARRLHQARRDLGIKYKNMTSPDVLERIYQRNIDKYSDKLGPTADWLRGRGRTWEDIIMSAKTPGKDFNDLAGIK